jgi:hypothetical protein
MAAQSADLNGVIDQHLAAFDKPGVLSVRPGFKVRNDWLTDQRCIVVTVRRKVALGVSLQPIEAQATIRLSASPDTGWPTLRDFLAATAGSLTVGLYDFTAAHIATAVTGSLAGKQLRAGAGSPAEEPERGPDRRRHRRSAPPRPR